MNFQLLGPVEATLAGRPVPLGAAKQRAVLAMLALHANGTLSVDRLVDGLWGQDPPATAAKMVQLYVSQLRRLLRMDDDAEIVTHGRGYELRVTEDCVDVARFERLLAEADRADGAGGDAAREALGLWHGGALADVADEPFAAAEIRRLEELRLTAAELAVDADLAVGRHERALPEITRLLEEDPLRERLHGQRMLALYRSGRQAEALEAYRAARRRLVDDVGVEPGSALRELHEQILRQDPQLALPAAEPLRRAPPPPPRPVHGRPAASSRPRRLWLVVAVASLATLAVFTLTRLREPDRLATIEANAVGVIDPASAAITEQYAGLGSAPGAVAAGGGSVWVASDPDGTVSRIRSRRLGVHTFDAGPAPVALAFGVGSLWVADEQDGAVRQVDPAHDRVVRTIVVGNGLHAVTVGDGAVWAATALDGEVVRIEPRSERLTRIPVSGHPIALATGARAVWVAAQDASDVVRVDPVSRETIDTIPVGNGPSAIAVGLGAVWTANQQDGTVSRIDPATDRAITVPAGRAPVALAIADGALWVADAAGALLRLDPRTGAVKATVRTGGAPVGLATSGGALWTSAAAPPSAHRGGTLRVGLADRPVPDWSTDLDPALGGNIGDAPMLTSLVHEGLLAFRRAPGVAGTRLVEGLARAVPAATDQDRRYVLRLRSGLRYSDGTAVHARDFRGSVERALAIGGPDGPQLLDAIVGAPACHTAPARCDLSRGIVADDRTGTITLHLSRADPELLESLAAPFFALVAPHAPRRPPLTGAPLGTGPYRVERLVPGVRAVLARNPYFRARGSSGRPAGFADRIVLVRGSEPALTAGLEHGRLDVVAPPQTATARDVEELHSRFGTGLHSGSLAGTQYAFLNVTRPPFDDPRVRLALNLAVDRARVVDLLGGTDAASTTCQVLPPGLPGYQPVCPFTAAPVPGGAWRAPDLTRARRLAAAARGMSVTVWTYAFMYPVAAYLADVLHELGFRSRVQTAASERAAQMGVAGWGADSPEPAGFLQALVACGNVNNASNFCDRGIDRAIARAQESGAAAWPRVERRIAREAPIVPLTNQRELAIASPHAGNLQFHPLEGLMLDRVWVR